MSVGTYLESMSANIGDRKESKKNARIEALLKWQQRFYEENNRWPTDSECKTFLESVGSKHGVKKCKAFYQRGHSVGKQCTAYALFNSLYCGKHQNYIDPEDIIKLRIENKQSSPTKKDKVAELRKAIKALTIEDDLSIINQDLTLAIQEIDNLVEKIEKDSPPSSPPKSSSVSIDRKEDKASPKPQIAIPKESIG